MYIPSNILVVNLGVLKLDHPTNPTFHHITIHTFIVMYYSVLGTWIKCTLYSTRIHSTHKISGVCLKWFGPVYTETGVFSHSSFFFCVWSGGRIEKTKQYIKKEKCFYIEFCNPTRKSPPHTHNTHYGLDPTLRSTEKAPHIFSHILMVEKYRKMCILTGHTCTNYICTKRFWCWGWWW